MLLRSPRFDCLECCLYTLELFGTQFNRAMQVGALRAFQPYIAPGSDAFVE